MTYRDGIFLLVGMTIGVLVAWVATEAGRRLGRRSDTEN
jgi:hypothetical protein